MNTLLSNFSFPLIFLVFFSIALSLRGIRWNLLISEELNHKIYYIKLTFIAWFLNATSPGRLGDISRVYIPRKEKIATAGRAFLAILIDRVFDLVVLALFLWISIFIGVRVLIGEFETIFTYLTFIGVITLIIGSLILIRNPQLFTRIVEIFSFGRESLKKRFQNFIINIKEGFLFLYSDPIRLLVISILTIIIWLFESSSVILISYSMGYTISLEVCFVASVMGFIGAVLPFLPSSFGSYELGIASTLFLLVSITFEEALLIAFLDHLVRQIFVVIIGGILFLNHFYFQNASFESKAESI